MSKPYHAQEYEYHRQCAEDDRQHARNPRRDEFVIVPWIPPQPPAAWVDWIARGMPDEEIPFDEPPSAA